MGKGEKMEPEKEPEDSEEETEEEEADTERRRRNEKGKKKEKTLTNYEKQRLSRIAENKARMEALGLHKMATCLIDSSQKPGRSRTPQKSTPNSKRKRPNIDSDDDGDYYPDADYADDSDEEEEGDDDEDEEFVVGKSSSKTVAKTKVKKKSPKPKKKLPVRGENVDEDDDDDLMQAISLSLQDSTKDTSFKERKGNVANQEEADKRKRKKSFNSRVQMTEDEVILHFFGFDESGKGTMTLRDLQRVAVAHDFTWTDEELADMIRYFDSDGDRKLNLEDFRKIVSRCNMIQGSET